MYYKIVNRFDVECLGQSVYQGNVMEGVSTEYKEKVMEAIRKTINIFDEYYGEQRHPESDLGGYLMFLTTLQDTELFYEKILMHYHLSAECAEVTEEITTSGNLKLIQQTFLLSSDYGIVILYPEQ
jgi:hypothetical protein